MTLQRAVPADVQAWAQDQWAKVNLGDARLNRRAVEIRAHLAAWPGASLPQQLGSWAASKATYRLLSNEKVSHARLSAPHWQATRQRAGGESLVLFIQDTTELDYTAYAQTMGGLGPIGNGKGQSLLLHTSLAVVPQPRQVLGVAHQQVYEGIPLVAGPSPTPPGPSPSPTHTPAPTLTQTPVSTHTPTATVTPTPMTTPVSGSERVYLPVIKRNP